MTRPPEKTVKVAELKARLSEYLRRARRGQAVTVCDRETPIARLVPYPLEPEPLPVRPPLRLLREVAMLPPLGGKIDSLAALLDERDPLR